MNNNFLISDQLSVPDGKCILTEKEYINRLPKKIDNLILNVKNKLVYNLKDGEGNFGIIYKKDGLVFKELLWKGNYHDHGSELRKITLEEGIEEINNVGMLEFEILKYIKECKIGVNTPEPIMYLNEKNISNNINVIEKNILFLKAFIKDTKHHDFINLLGVKQIMFQLINGLNSIAFEIYKKHFKKKLINLINIKTITRPVIIMTEMRGFPIRDNIENKILFDRYKKDSKKLENIGIYHDGTYGNILYDEGSDKINLIDFGCTLFTDNMKVLIEKDKKNFMKKYPYIFNEVFSDINN